MGKVYLGTYSSIIDEKGNLWFSDTFHNALMNYNINEKRMCFIGSFPKIELMERDIHFATFYVNNKIIFLPIKTEYVHIYNITDNTFDAIRIPEHKGGIRYVEATCLNGEVFFASEQGRIMHLNLCQKCVEVEENATQIIIECLDTDSMDLVSICGYSRGFAVENKKKGCIYLVDISNNKCDTIFISGMNKNVYKIVEFQHRLYLIFSDSQIVIEYDLENAGYNIYKPVSEEWNDNNTIVPYSGVFFIDGNIVLLNYYAKHIGVLDKQKKEVHSFSKIPGECCLVNVERDYGPTYSSIVELGNIEVFVPGRARKILFYDKKEECYYTEDFFIDSSDYNDYPAIMKKYIEKNTLLKEGAFGLDLEQYIKY